MLRRCITLAAATATLTAAMTAGVAVAGTPGGPNGPTVVATFPAGSFPESMVAVPDGFVVTLGFAGDVVTVTPSGTQTLLAHIDLDTPSLLTGVVVDGTYAYVARAPYGGVGQSWIYRIPLAGGDVTAWPFAADGSFPNGLAVRDGVLYVADMAAGAIRTVSLSTGEVAATPWCADPLLEPGRYGFGVNGITFRGNALYASVSDAGRIVKVTKSGSACTVQTVVEQQQLSSADGIAFVPGTGFLLVTVNTTNRLFAVDVTTGVVVPLANRSSGLSYPTQPLVIGDALYVTNGAIANGVADLIRFDVDAVPLP